jgi:hypothetical protein
LRYGRWMLPLSVPFGLGPQHSDVHVENDTLHHDRVTRWGVHGWRGRWAVNGSSKGMVELTIDPPVRARVTGGLP